MGSSADADSILTDDLLEQLHTDGVVCLRGVLERRWLDHIASGIETREREPSPMGDILSMPDDGFLSDLFMWRRDPDFRAIVFDSPLGPLAARALGSDTVVHFYDQLFVKEPGSPVPTEWHHDLTYWPVDGERIVTFWIPLDPVTRHSGGMEFVPGSHRGPERYKAITNDRNELMIDPDLDDAPDVDARREELGVIGWDMEPGDVLAFHPLLLHGSSGNTSTTVRRRAMASRWATPDVRYAPARYRMPLPPGHELEAGDPLGGPLFPVVVGTR